MIIPGRFNGPPGSANGGYTCGMLASYVQIAADGARAVAVTLRQPPPLDRVLTLSTSGEEVSVYDGERLVASGAPVPEFSDEPVPPATFDEALTLGASYPGHVAHPFPTCFVCGPEREDGLRLFPGRLSDGRTAAAWHVPEDVSTNLVWAALDCPGGWTIGIESRPYVLGRLTAAVSEVPGPGEECVVMGRLVGTEGRKAYADTTLYSSTGSVLARAHAVWIALPTA